MLYIVAAYWFTSSTSFANLAITVASGLSNPFAGITPSDVPLFVVAQFVGAMLAVVLAGWLFAPTMSSADYPSAMLSRPERQFLGR